MTRTVARQIAVHLVFSTSFADRSAEQVLQDMLTEAYFARLREDEPLYATFPDPKQEAYIRTLVQGVFAHGAELDQYIARYAVGWSFARISRVAASIMRVAMYEILYMPDIPNAVAINAAVEIAKRYEPPEVVSFINGILGTFIRGEVSHDAQKSDSDEHTGD